jgi:uncharacterized protein (DUF2236 family)
MLQPSADAAVDFTRPAGEPALVAPDSVSWRVFKNPVSLFIGGVAAVILELAEPRVRTGVWEHTKFRSEPLNRMQRTGLAAMVTVYGARSTAEAMIAGIRRRHERIEGVTPCGKWYRASDPELLTWVHATAGFGFLEAYSRFAAPLSREERDRFYTEGRPVAELYGAVRAPGSAAQLDALFSHTFDSLQPSEIVFEFLDIIRHAALVPAPLRPLQRLFVRAAVETVPPPVRQILQLDGRWSLGKREAKLVRLAGAAADRIIVDASPPVQACTRLGLPPTYLYGPARR